MPLFGVNMAVPVKDHRESQIYFLSSGENVQPSVERLDTKYLVFKTLELVISLCALVLFAYGMQDRENEIINMIKYIGLGGITIHPLLFILQSMDTKKRMLYMVITNVWAIIILFAISGSTTPFWRYSTYADKEAKLGSLNQLRSSLLCVINGFLYLTETMIMCFESRSYCGTNNSL